MEPFGLALLDYLEGDRSAAITVRRDDGFTAVLEMSHFFRGPEGFAEIEKEALDRCRAPVLDVGAGAGSHSLELQRRGVAVTAIDVCPQAVEVMRGRGVQDAREADVHDFEGGAYRSVLVLGRSIGLAQTLQGLDLLLTRLQGLLAKGGEILCDSLDVRATSEDFHLAYHEANRQAGRYVGQSRMRFEYKDRIGEWTGWLHVDPDILRERACDAGLSCAAALRLPTGEFLARLAAAE